MQFTCYVREFSDSDVDGDVHVEPEMFQVKCYPSMIGYELAELVPGMQLETPLAWSSSQPDEFSWLTLSGSILSFREGDPQWFDLSIHAPLNVLRRIKYYWDKW